MDINLERQKAILKEVSSWSSSEAAVPLMPDTDDAKIRCIALAYIKDDAKKELALKLLEKFLKLKLLFHQNVNMGNLIVFANVFFQISKKDKYTLFF